MKNIRTKTSDVLRPFGLRDKIGYACGDLGTDIILTLYASFLMIYYTNVLGLEAAIVGIMFFFSKFLDAFLDVITGSFCDFFKFKGHEKFKPIIRIMKYPFCIHVIFVFLPFVSALPIEGRYIYALVTYILSGVFLATVNIPYGALASSLTPDPKDKVSISTFRTIGASTANAIGGFVFPLILYVTIDGNKVLSQNRFVIVAIGVCLAGLLLFKVLDKNTEERVHKQNKKDKVKLKVLLSGLLKNKALITFSIADFIFSIYEAYTNALPVYLYNDYFKDNAAMSLFLCLEFLGIFIIAPVAGIMSKKYGKKNTTVYSLFFSGLLYVLITFLQIDNAYVYIVVTIFTTFGKNVFRTLVWAHFADIIDYQFILTHQEDSGTIFGINCFFRKLGQAAAAAISGIVITMVGYQSSTEGGLIQSTEVVNGLYFYSNIIPGIIMLIVATLILIFYPMNRTEENNLTKKLEAISNSNEKDQGYEDK